MKTIQTDLAQDNSLRVVFSEAMVTLNLSANATFGDIARKLGKLSKRRYGNPRDISVTLGPASRTLPLEISRRLPVHLPAFMGRAPARAVMRRPASRAMVEYDDRKGSQKKCETRICYEAPWWPS
jgi:hypothetical protein